MIALRIVAKTMKMNPMIKTKEVSCSVVKRMKNNVPMAKQPRASSVEVRPSKGSSWIRVVCMI
ncbi:hypothetical protein [Flavobacterium aquiphilum]|uniref:hypothetical protein n=1 Tax=Flavobacterium aquiphilum TaxID=3003261 RepID=UPI0024808A93|nr:hypothetical protein [Flavobacterium aquiphilum]